MSKFNASISYLGIIEPKVQQAIMKLLENSLWNRETANSNRGQLEEQIRRLSQKVSANAETEAYAWGWVDTYLNDVVINMAAVVGDATASYNVKVTFRNTDATDRTCKVNGTTVTLKGGDGETATHTATVSGNGIVTINNEASSVDVFIRIWR